MPKKKFEEGRYSSVDAVVLRDALAVGRTAPRGERVAVGGGDAAETAAEEAPSSPPVVAAAIEAAPAPVPSTPPPAPRPSATVVPMPERSPAPPQTQGRGKLTEGKMKRFRLAQEEDLQIEDALASIRRRTRQRVTLSHVARAGCELLVRFQDDIVEELERNPLPPPPSTQDTVGYAAYDEEILKRLRRVYRRARS